MAVTVGAWGINKAEDFGCASCSELNPSPTVCKSGDSDCTMNYKPSMQHPRKMLCWDVRVERPFPLQMMKLRPIEKQGLDPSILTRRAFLWAQVALAA